MTDRACARRWETEAVEDGRLDGQASASFERHLAVCAECGRERLALRQVDELASACDAPQLSLLEHRRGRAVLLKSAHRRSLELGRERSPWRAVLAAGLAAAAVALLWFVERPNPRGPIGNPALSASATPRYELVAKDDAAWSNQSVGAFACLALARGLLSVHVEHLQKGQRFVVKLPDGQLEVRGTRFVVEADAGLTRAVAVTEGVVELTLAGNTTRRLVAGQHWARAEEPSAVDANPRSGVQGTSVGALGGAESAPARATPAGSHPAPPSTRAEPSPRSAPNASRIHEHSPLAVTPRTNAAVGGGQARASLGGGTDEVAVATAQDAGGERSTPDAKPAGSAADGFAAAMRAFSAGAYLDADDRFADFARRFPRDSRCEDALFLRAVLAVRSGDRAAALSRATEYLRRFPGGLRRNEMARVAASGELAEGTQRAR